MDKLSQCARACWRDGRSRMQLPPVVRGAQALGLAALPARPAPRHGPRHPLGSRGGALQEQLRVGRCLLSAVRMEEPAASQRAAYPLGHGGHQGRHVVVAGWLAPHEGITNLPFTGVAPSRAATFFPDGDGDGHGDGGLEGQSVCPPPVGSVALSDDCDDGEATVWPGAPELCDGLDNDCDGKVDEDWPLGDPCTTGVGACAEAGTLVCGDDGLGASCSAISKPPAEEACDGVGNDCDGDVDEGYGLGEECTVGVGACAAVGVKECGADGGVRCSAAELPAPAGGCTADAGGTETDAGEAGEGDAGTGPTGGGDIDSGATPAAGGDIDSGATPAAGGDVDSGEGAAAGEDVVATGVATEDGGCATNPSARGRGWLSLALMVAALGWSRRRRALVREPRRG